MIRRTQGERRESQLSLKAIASTWEFASICITLRQKTAHGHHLLPFNQPWLSYDHQRYLMWCIHQTILEGPCKGCKPGRSFHGPILKTPKENGRAHPGTYVCRTWSRFHRLLITGQKKNFLANKKHGHCFDYWIWNPMMKNNEKSAQIND